MPPASQSLAGAGPDAVTDGRWIAEIPELPGVMTYGKTPQEALSRVKALALRTLADMMEHGDLADLSDLPFAAT